MRALIFVLLIVLALPLLICGFVIYTWRVRRIVIPQNISGTANEPFGGRLAMHVAGTYKDEVAYKIAQHTPGYGGIVRFLFWDTLGFCAKLSGFKGGFFAYPGPRPSTLMTMMSHRTHFFNQSIQDVLTREDNPATQLVVLGAGFDTRCYNLPEGKDFKCFEVDMSPTLKAKKRALQLAEVAHDHVTFVETDFNQEIWLEALLDSGFNPNLTTSVSYTHLTLPTICSV